MWEVLGDEWVTDGGKWNVDRSSWMQHDMNLNINSHADGSTDGEAEENSNDIHHYKPLGDISNITSEEMQGAIVTVNKMTMLIKLKNKMARRATATREQLNAKHTSKFNHTNGIVSTSSALSKDFFKQVNDALPPHLKNNKFKVTTPSNVAG
jgi:hypothetical protein